MFVVMTKRDNYIYYIAPFKIKAVCVSVCVFLFVRESDRGTIVHKCRKTWSYMQLQ